MRRAALFLILPFFLQLLGLGDTPLGGGLCGEVFRVQDPAFALKTPGFWYGLLFMVLLALEPSSSFPFWRCARGKGG